MSLERNIFIAPLKKYTTTLNKGDVPKKGFLFFCGRPASWIGYIVGSKKKKSKPTIDEARENTNTVCRDPKSFRPSTMFTRLKKTTVYPAIFVFDSFNKVLRYVTVYDENNENIIETYFYSPLV